MYRLQCIVLFRHLNEQRRHGRESACRRGPEPGFNGTVSSCWYNMMSATFNLNFI